MSVIETIAQAIIRQEGNAPGTRAHRNNNPGNIWDGVGAGKSVRIWPNLPTDDKGFVIYPTYEAGYQALLNDIRIKVNRGMTLEQLITMYAPPSENDTAAYIANVSAWTGLPTGHPLNQLPEPSAGEPDIPATFPAVITLPAVAAGVTPSSASILPGVDDIVVIGAVFGLALLAWWAWRDA